MYGRTAPPYICTYSQFAKVQSGKMGPAPGRFELSIKGHVKVNISNGSGIRDPQMKLS